MLTSLLPIAGADWLALGWFVLCWLAYAWLIDYRAQTACSVTSLIHAYRREWMCRLLERDNRIVDSTLIGNLMRSVSFLASTTLIIIGTLLAALGTSGQTVALLAQLPFAVPPTRLLWEIKLLLLLCIFVYAFFKFAWSLRQFNYCNILIGAAPDQSPPDAETVAYAEQMAHLNALAGNHYNRGLRAFYFALAALAWFINPWLFMAASTWVIGVLYYREYASATLAALRPPVRSLPTAAGVTADPGRRKTV